MDYKHLEYPITGFTISVALLFAIIFSVIGITIAKGQDTLHTEPYHVTNPSAHKDTLYLKGHVVKHLVDSLGTAVFIYDPEQGFWTFNSSLSTGLIDN